MKKLFILLFIPVCVSCTQNANQPVSIGDNTFVYQTKVYRVIDNQITELGDIRSDSIARSKVLNSAFKAYGDYALDYVKQGATCELSAVYRGDILYFKFELKGFNDLTEKYSYGYLTINLLDEYGFNIHEVNVLSSDLIRILNTEGETMQFEYSGKTKMSAEIYAAISHYSISSTIRNKNRI